MYICLLLEYRTPFCEWTEYIWQKRKAKRLSTKNGKMKKYFHSIRSNRFLHIAYHAHAHTKSICTVNNNVCSYWKIVTEGSKYEVNVILFKVHTHCYGRMHTQRQIYCKIKYIEQSTESIWCGIETSMCQSHAYIHKQSVIRFTMLFYPIWRCLQITFFIVCAQCRADARWYPIYTYIFVSPKT